MRCLSLAPLSPSTPPFSHGTGFLYGPSLPRSLPGYLLRTDSFFALRVCRSVSHATHRLAFFYRLGTLRRRRPCPRALSGSATLLPDCSRYPFAARVCRRPPCIWCPGPVSLCNATRLASPPPVDCSPGHLHTRPFPATLDLLTGAPVAARRSCNGPCPPRVRPAKPAACPASPRRRRTDSAHGLAGRHCPRLSDACDLACALAPVGG